MNKYLARCNRWADRRISSQELTLERSVSFSQISLIKFLVSEEEKKVYVLQGLAGQNCSLLWGNAYRQPQAALGEQSLSSYLRKDDVVLHRPQTLDSNQSQLLLKINMLSQTVCLGVCSHVCFPWKAGTITKTAFVSFNKVMCSLELTGARLSLCAFLGYHSLLSGKSQKSHIKTAQLSKIATFGCIYQMLLKNSA